uniref:NADH-ubiquinone oxidoreductase chain 2 n=1 Tax=Ptenothrix huangshanensis TaxID=2583244 RepID=A0A6H0EX25_9HEXA|nr:NADH dehydrogenase subunit 2 [Ptenothrix huangshanensis]
MFLKSSNTIFVITLVISTIISISCNSWLTCWLGLEINLMAMVPLLIYKMKFNSTNATIKYFLMQALTSIVMVSAYIIFFYFNFNNSVNMMSELLTMAMMMKLGIPPFQFWLPQVVELASAMQSFIILTWQKIAPFNFLTYMNSNIILFFIILTATIGSIGGLNQNSLMKILAYSSMSHAAWLMVSLNLEEKIWLIYFTIYTMILMFFFIFIKKMKTKKISTLLKQNIENKLKMTFSTILLSMGGLPPFLGFLGKILILQKSMNFFSISLIVVLLIASFISLLFYTRICFMIFLKSNISLKMENMNKNKIQSKMLWLILMSNLVAPLMVLLI